MTNTFGPDQIPLSWELVDLDTGEILACSVTRTGVKELLDYYQWHNLNRLMEIRKVER